MVALSFERSGPSGGPHILLLHGLSSSRESWSHVSHELASEGWSVVRADLRGHGDSPRASNYNVEGYVTDVAGLILAELGGSALVIGQSLGGLTAHRLAQRHPDLVRGVLLGDPPLFEGDDGLRAASPAAAFFPTLVARIRAWQADDATEEEVAAAMGAQPSPLGGTTGERLGVGLLAARARAVLAFDPGAMEAAINGEMWRGYDPLAPVGCPMTIIAADPDVGAVLRPEQGMQLLDVNPRAVVRTVAGQAHSMHDDRDGHRLFMAVVGEFLQPFEP